jgi:pyrroloquinoline-quinone synthase
MRDHLARLKERLAPRENPYFAALREGTFGREDFLETQIQFLFAVVFFPRPMATLAARLPRPEQRLALLENVADEHGGGDLARSHEATFLELLHRLGVERAEVERRALWPEVRAFNTLLGGLCLLDDVYTALAALGIIEDLFAGLSAQLGQGLVARGWLPEDEVVHYATHERLDVHHAEGFYRLLDGPCRESPRALYQAQQGLELGGYAFLRLYEDLYRARGRRALREVSGPHSLADGWSLG